MKHVESNGFIFSSDDDISISKPSANGGLRKKVSANRLDVASLDILAACIEQITSLNLQATRIIEALKADLQKE